MHASKKGYKTGLYLEYDNYDFLQSVMEKQKFKHVSTAINFILREQRKLVNEGKLDFAEKEPEQLEDDTMDIYSWLTS